MKRLLARVAMKAKRGVFRLWMRPVRRNDMERIGTTYGGWIVPTSLLGADSVCYAAGVGEDITFDLGLIDRVGCTVHAFDPTPRAAVHVAATARDRNQFVFHEYGLWSSDTVVPFYAPRDETWVSHSIVNLQGTSEFFEAPVKRLRTIMRELGHDRIDLLKIDIEGAEYEVLTDMLLADIPCRVLAVEFDQPVPLRRTVAMVQQLRRQGYVPCAVDRWNVTFVRDC